METNETNGISVRRLRTFLTSLKNIFATSDHTHATVNGHSVESDVPADAKFMTEQEKTKLDGITSGANTKHKELTQTEYTALGSNYEKDTVYFIKD